MSINQQLKSLTIEHGRITDVHWSDDLQIELGETVFNEVPPRTIVRLHLSPVSGSNIQVEIWLPDQELWNGCFIGYGNGGSAGAINSGQFVAPIKEGYAVATTDMGTAPDSDSGIGNSEVWKDFGFRATHLMTTNAKQIIEAFYEASPRYSYFVGGSTGGQQALQEAQRYPDDYDGIVALVPAHCRTPLHAYFLWNAQILAACPFTEEQEQHVIDAGNALSASREPNVFKNKVVSDPRCSVADIEMVIKDALQRDPSLTVEHAQALRKLFNGPRHSKTAKNIFDGVPLGSSFRSAAGHLYVFKWAFGEGVDLQAINFAKDIDVYTQKLAPYLTADNPDLSAFNLRGGKLIMVSGTNDAIVPYHATLDYYERVVEAQGSLKATQDFCRFFLVPGKGHGGSGSGLNTLPNMLQIIRAWRETGSAPDVLHCRREIDGETLYEMPVFPYPLIAVDDGNGKIVPQPGKRGGVGRVDDTFLPEAKA